MSPARKWPICLGFDGSEVDDWTGIRAETYGGWQFTPTYGPIARPTYWDPSQWGGEIPRGEVHAAVDALFRTFDVRRMYCDPRGWTTEIERWALEHGDEIVLPWDTGRGSSRIRQMHEELERFRTDLKTGALTHDGCPATAEHMANARMIAKPGDRYILGKPAGAEHQKIDLAMASVICHTAACDARADGWTGEPPDTRVLVFR